MKLLLDTSVLIAAMVAAHPAHANAVPWLQRIKNGDDEGVVAAHTLAELYSVLTTLPHRPRLTPAHVQQLIRSNIIGFFSVVSLTATDYATVVDELAALGVTGGAIYDALLMKAAANAGVEQVVTLNPKHFRRVAPSFASQIVSA
jgi:predicted nucleic acid-binding protein